MKHTAKLSYRKLNNIIRESVKRVLMENDKWMEMNQDWRDLAHDYQLNPHTYYRPIGKHDNGYNREFEVSEEELEMYKSIGNPSQYVTKGESDRYRRNKDGYGYHRVPTRNDFDGDLSIAAQSDPITCRYYDGYIDILCEKSSILFRV